MRHSPLVLVVEDEPAVAQLITVNLSHNGFRPVWAADGVQAQRAMVEALPNLILLDWMLPGESGIELVKLWRDHSTTKDIPIILLTARDNETDRVAGLNAGADDYLAKPFSIKELIARIRALLRRSKPEKAEDPIHAGPLCLDPVTHRVSLDGQYLKVGPTEYKLLRFLMLNTERVHSRAHLLDKVWGDQVYIEERTVDVHIKRLRQSLAHAGHMIETVRGAGYRLTRVPVNTSQVAAAD